MKPRRWIIPVIAAVLALGTTIAIISYLQNLRQRAAVLPAPVETEAVVVAKTNIGERKIVTADALELREIPVEAVHPQAAQRIEDVANRVAVAPIFAGEQVLTIKLAPAGVNVGLAYVLPKDSRAMTIAVNEVIGVAGFVFPGDRVDVVATVTATDTSFSKIVLQNVPVLAIAQKVEQKPGEEPRVTTSATLALTPEQTEVLAQVDISGKVRLALRPYGVTALTRTPGKTIDAALGRATIQPAAAVKAAATRTTVESRPARRTTPRVTTVTLPARTTLRTVELWRATTKSTLPFSEEQK